MDISVDIGGIRMANPVMVASGTFGYGPEFADVTDISRLGAIVVKGIKLDPCDGNPPPRMVEVPGGLVNAIGLQGPGVKGFVEEYMPFLRETGVPVIVNVWGTTLEEYGEVSARLSDVDGISGLELNISCPNIKEGGIAFGTDPSMAAAVMSNVRSRTSLPVIPKLSPNVPDISVFAKIAEESGCDAISLINTLPAMVIDVETRRPVLANVTGGLSGPAVHPVAVKLVWETAKAVSIPVIGMGGIFRARDAIELIIAGASAVAVGTANFTDPTSPIQVIEGIESYLNEHGLDRIDELIGSVELDGK
ncbi:MAG: dihydroorotate dehydrogenase [Kiritimatiellia bacterium]|nr:dihydroorotate dehydrogenase [Kiritimatiellia bacterium]MDP6848818.1 dihydroorotate dehydrogenase [Kiritimatiellia bacterium]